MTIDIEHMGVHILNESDVCAMIEKNAALAAALERTLCLGREMAGYVKSYGLDDWGPQSEWSRWKKCRDALASESLPTEILVAHDAAVRQKVLLDEWEHDWPVIFATIADEPDERLAPDAQTTKQAILEAIEKSGWLKQHDAAVRKPLLEALRNLLSYWSEACGDSEDCDRYAGRIDQIDSLLSRYNDDGSER